LCPIKREWWAAKLLSQTFNLFRAYERSTPQDCIGFFCQRGQEHITDQRPATALMVLNGHGHLGKSVANTRPGKRLHKYGKSPCLMGKLTISMAILKIAM